MESAAKDLLLTDDLAVSHVGRPLDLTLDIRGIQRATAVVRGRDLVDADRPGLEVDGHLRDRRLVRIRGGWPDARSLE